MKRLPIVKLNIGKEEFDLVCEPLKTGWIVQGPYVKEFENNIAQFVGARYAVAVNSCTSGQFIMSRILDLKPGDEVIVPSYTWISTVNSIEFLGAKAVFCDVDIGTFNIRPDEIEGKINRRTRAIYPVHLFGLGADMPAIMQMAKDHRLQVVEDCACALGSRIGGTHCGRFSAGGVFSFHPRKSITTGEGGMIVTDREEVAWLAASLRDHGAAKSDFVREKEKGGFLLGEYAFLGYNFRMTDLQGALGVAQFKKIHEIIEKKQKLAAEYNERMKQISFLRAPETPPGFFHSYQTYCTLFQPESAVSCIRKKDFASVERLHGRRNKIMAHLEEKGISTRQGTHAVHIQKLYREKYDFQPMDFPASYVADRLTMALPFYPSITPEEIDYLFEHLKKAESAC
jgi:perosamine synthetase